MAFKGRSSREQFKVISVNDPALDRSPAAFEAIAKYSKDRDFETVRPHILPGMEPTIFVCRPLSHEGLLLARSLVEFPIRCVAAFEASVVGIENLELDPPWRFNSERDMVDSGFAGEKHLAKSVIKLLAESQLSTLVEEVGFACLQRAMLLPDQKKVFALPHGYWVVPPATSDAGTSTTTVDPPGSS